MKFSVRSAVKLFCSLICANLLLTLAIPLAFAQPSDRHAQVNKETYTNPSDVWSSHLPKPNLIPAKPELLSPPNGTISTNITLIWKPVFGATSYWLKTYYSNGSLFQFIPTSNTSYQASYGNGTYSWQVQAFDSLGGGSALSDRWYFTVDSTNTYHSISGNAGKGGATMSFTGGSAVTALSDGKYSIAVPLDWSGTVTPSMTGFSFLPASISYTNVVANQIDQNYIALSANANLSNMVLSTGALTPGFSAGTTAYTQSVANGVSSLTITPTVAYVNASVTVNGSAVTSGSSSGAIPLAVGANIIDTVVTAEDGITLKTYTVTVTRAPATNADLSNLVFSSGVLTPAFAADTLVYTQSVGSGVTSLTVTPTVADSTATVTVNGTQVSSGTPSEAIALVAGDNTITTVVTAQDGITQKTYIVTVARSPSTNADLSDLEFSTGALTPEFSSGITVYSQAVGGSVISVTVTPTVADPAATVAVNGTPVNSGSPSGAIPLAVGDNTITTVVTAEDGTTTQTYTVTVTRAVPSSNADLSSLAFSTGALMPEFATGTMAYTQLVDSGVTSVTVTPTVADSAATVTVNGAQVTSGSPSEAIALVIGDNIITTVVTAEDGTTSKVYTVILTCVYSHRLFLPLILR